MALLLSHFSAKRGEEITPLTTGTSCLDKMHLRWKWSTHKVPDVSSRCCLRHGLWEGTHHSGTSLPVASVTLAGDFGHALHCSQLDPRRDPCLWPPTHTFPCSRRSPSAGDRAPAARGELP